MKKILFYSAHKWDHGGTARSHELLIANIDRTKYEPYALYWKKGNNTRLFRLKQLLGKNLIPFSRSENKSGPKQGWTPESTDFAQVVEKIKPDIIHVARSGYYEWPFTSRMAPVQIETNIFGSIDKSGFVDHSIFVSDTVSNGSGTVIPNPIPEPVKTSGCREKFDIPESAFVFGRIGRPANFTSIALEAFRRLVEEYPRAYFLIVAPCGQTREYVKSHRIPNVVFVGETPKDAKIRDFFSACNAFAHYRSDGETCGCAIQQAMSYGLPVVSHRSNVFNAHMQTIGDAGIVTGSDEGYLDAMKILMNNGPARRKMSIAGVERYKSEFAADVVTRQVEKVYQCAS